MGNGLGTIWRRLLGASAIACALAVAAAAQTEQRAEPITGPGVTTIGNIAPGETVSLRSGPSPMFPSVGRLSYGTRINTHLCFGLLEQRWCQVETMDGRLSGFVNGRYLVRGGTAPPTVEDAGPDYWAVRGLPPGDLLNVRRDPSGSSPALATLREGEIVRNRGCQTVGQTRWCRIASTTGMDVTGWVAGRYLRESGPPPATGGGPGAGSGAHGPDGWVVTGLTPGDRLNLRAEPSTSAAILGTLGQGEALHNLGCQTFVRPDGARSAPPAACRVTGWVSGRYLREG